MNIQASSELTWQEDQVIDVFHVTGFFGSKAKPNVGRRFSMVVNQIVHGSTAPGMSMEDIAGSLVGLESKGLLAIDRAKSIASLTDAGFAYVSAPDFAKRARLPVPPEATKPRPQDPNEGALFGVVMGTSLGGD